MESDNNLAEIIPAYSKGDNIPAVEDRTEIIYQGELSYLYPNGLVKSKGTGKILKAIDSAHSAEHINEMNRQRRELARAAAEEKIGGRPGFLAMIDRQHRNALGEDNTAPRDQLNSAKWLTKMIGYDQESASKDLDNTGAKDRILIIPDSLAEKLLKSE